MIEPVVELVRAAVVAPQEVVADSTRRAWQDEERAPLGVTVNDVETIPLTTTPILPQIGAGFGGLVGGVINLRHVIAVTLTVRDATRSGADVTRGNIIGDLVARALRYDWVNADLGPDQDITDVQATIEYADVETGNLAAYATLVLTIDTEWRP